MKDWEDIIKERQLSRKAELPESDWNDFLSRRAAHERAVKKRHWVLAAAISIPAAAAVLLLLFLVPLNTVVPDNQVSQNEPLEQQVSADSVDVNTVDSVMVPADPESEKILIKEPKPVKKIFAQDKQPKSQPEIADTFGEPQINQLLAEVPVSAVVAKVTAVTHNDTAIFNSVAYRLPEGESVEELIRKLPGVEIDSIGNITVNGKAVSRILVNGKEFFNDDNSKPLTQLTAEMIEKVKAYEKNSDLSRQTGIDDGREALVLDIRKPIIVLDGKITDVDNEKLAELNFKKTVRKRKLARLLGIPANKIKSINQYDAASAMKIWGEQGEYGAISVVTKK